MDKWTRGPCLRCWVESLGALGCMQVKKTGGRLLGWAVVTWQIVTARSTYLLRMDTSTVLYITADDVAASC